MKDYRNQTPPTLPEYLYNVGHTAAYIALRARGQYSEFLRSLNTNQYADRITEQAADYMTTATEYRAQHAQHRTHADTLREEADRLYTLADSYTATPTDRAAYLHRADELSTAAERESQRAGDKREAAEDTEQEHSTRLFSDREDVTHEAICAYLDTMSGEDWSNQDARDRAFLAAIKAAGAYAARLAAAKGATNNATKVISMTEDERQRATKQGETITAEEAAQRAAAKRADIIRRYGNLDVKIPFPTRGAMLDGWTTYEHRDTPKYKGWYMVQHYKRIAPAPIDETAQNVAIRKDIFDNYDVSELVSIGKFSEREAHVLSLLAEINGETPASDEAQAVADAGQTAVNAYRAECDTRKRACTVQASRDRIERQFASAADRVRRDAELTAAYAICGASDSSSAIRTAISTLRARVDNAISAAQHDAPPTISRDTISAQPPRVTVTITSAPDTRTSAQRQHGSEYATMCINWTSRATITEDTSTSAAPVRDNRLTTQHNAPAPRPVWTPSAAQLDAQRAALDYWTREHQRDSRHAQILFDRAQHAQRAAEDAQRAADAYSTSDHSDPARAARIAATSARQAAQDAQRRAEQAAHDRDEDASRAASLTDYISRHS